MIDFFFFFFHIKQIVRMDFFFFLMEIIQGWLRELQKESLAPITVKKKKRKKKKGPQNCFFKNPYK